MAEREDKGKKEGGLGWKRGRISVEKREDKGGKDGGLGWGRGTIRVEERRIRVKRGRIGMGREGGLPWKKEGFGWKKR